MVGTGMVLVWFDLFDGQERFWRLGQDDLEQDWDRTGKGHFPNLIAWAWAFWWVDLFPNPHPSGVPPVPLPHLPPLFDPHHLPPTFAFYPQLVYSPIDYPVTCWFPTQCILRCCITVCRSPTLCCIYLCWKGIGCGRERHGLVGVLLPSCGLLYLLARCLPLSFCCLNKTLGLTNTSASSPSSRYSPPPTPPHTAFLPSFKTFPYHSSLLLLNYSPPPLYHLPPIFIIFALPTTYRTIYCIPTWVHTHLLPRTTYTTAPTSLLPTSRIHHHTHRNTYLALV